MTGETVDLFAGAGGWDVAARQLGNAIPPLLALHILAEATGATLPAEAAA